MKRHLLSILAAFVVATAFAQYTTKRTYDLAVDYGIDCNHDHTLAEHGYTMAQVQVKFPAWVAFCKFEGWADAEVLSVYEIVAAANDAVWRGDQAMNINTPWPNDGCISRSNVIWPHGGYRINYHVLFAHGQHIGQGTGNWTEFGDRPCKTMGGTLLQVDHGKWLTRRAPDRNIFQSAYFGKTNVTAWSESVRFQGFRLEGGRWGMKHDPSFHSSGIVMWDAGEASHIEQIMANGFNDYGLELIRGTPNTCYTISTFCNGIAGVGILGNNGLSTSTFVSISGDDQPALVRVRPFGNSDVGGGTMVFVGVKSETGKRTPIALQKVFDGVGAINAVFDGVWAHADGSELPDAAFVVDFQGYPGQLDIRGARMNGYRTAVNVINKGLRIHGPASYVPWSLVVNEGGFVSGTRAFKSDPIGTPTEVGPVSPTEPVTPTEPVGNKFGVTSSFPQHSTYEGVAAMIDGNASTRWTSGRAPTTDDWIILDMGADAKWKYITLDATGSPQDFLSGLQVSVSANGTSWSKLSTTTAANATVNAVYGAVTKLTSSTWRTNRYVKIAPSVASSKWWSIHEITVE